MAQDKCYWIQRALVLADKASEQGEVPIGAVLVSHDNLIGCGWNQQIVGHDPTAHAEIQALRDAGQHIHNYRLIDTVLYVTLEPCLMCLGALFHARIKHLVFGAFDPKLGATRQLETIMPSQNHKFTWEGGILANQCAKRLQDFFKQRR